MSQAAIVVDQKDNVATALRVLAEGDSISMEVGGRAIDVFVQQSIPFGHKIALTDIEAGQSVIKYGEVIGLATKRITRGQHVHIHNVAGPKERGDGE
jgi:altronate dehydratase small subunit